ncbi:type II toxin-antitoxin system RelE/ParE family toxin [Candidatus Gottesmanbacteria bacterium]|nr:type II toxin-antitoxin system RelE/ParE family toxin [Candidatus Gottesmanbacteria bacterium]
MPAKQFILPQSVQKHAKRLPKHIQKRLPHAFLLLKANPIAGEKLQGKLSRLYKYRLGDYRIVYSFDTKTSRVVVVSIEHRQGVYK